MNLGLGIGLRAGGVVGYAPGALSNIAHAWRADLGITLNSGNVAQWNDQIGTAHLIQATGGNQPAYNASDAGYGGFPTVQAGTTGKFLAAAGVTTNQAFTVWLIGEFSTMGNIVFALNAGAPYIVNSSGNIAMFAGTSVSSGIAANAKHATMATFNGASSKICVDNWLTGGTTGSAGATNGSAVGAFGQSNGAFTTIGKLAEIIIQSGTPSSADKTLMANYVVRYGITVT